MTVYIRKHERDCDGTREIRFTRYPSARTAKKAWNKALSVREGHISWHRVKKSDYIAAMEQLKNIDED
jgi:hypothetical protein